MIAFHQRRQPFLIYFLTQILWTHYNSFSNTHAFSHSSSIKKRSKAFILHHSTEDNRPHEQRRTKPRTARRLNHSFQHLHRHNSTRYDDTEFKAEEGPKEYLMKHGGYSEEGVEYLSREFPPLFTLDIERHLKPKLRFVKYTLLNGKDTEWRRVFPPCYFGTRLERIVAPRHAFLVYHDLYHGGDLFSGEKMRRFLAVRSSSQFASLANAWRREQQNPDILVQEPFTSKQVEAFERLFHRGLLSACRDDAPPHLKQTAGVDGSMASLLIMHGANPYERDTRGVTLLHWACGAGNIAAVKALEPYLDIHIKAERDGATPLHWAAVGVGPKCFGSGGHYHLCQRILKQDSGSVNAVTKDGNSVLMWASWAGSLPIVKLLVKYGADIQGKNRNGCTIAHWASSGGSVEVCRYLFEKGVSFRQKNYAGNSPLSHAVAYGRGEVVVWLREEVVGKDDEDVGEAAKLAKDFVGWMDGDAGRKDVLQLFS